MDKRPAPSKTAKDLIERFFKGNKILDEDAFEEARAKLPPEDQALLDDMRAAAFEFEDIGPEDILGDG